VHKGLAQMIRTLVLVTFSSCLMFEFSEIFIIFKVRILLGYDFFYFFFGISRNNTI
jgi:hypothetical protein